MSQTFFPVFLHPSALLPAAANSENIFQALPHLPIPTKSKIKMRENIECVLDLLAHFLYNGSDFLKTAVLVNFLVKPICINMIKIKLIYLNSIDHRTRKMKRTLRRLAPFVIFFFYEKSQQSAVWSGPSSSSASATYRVAMNK